jgi:hypothetical protein
MHHARGQGREPRTPSRNSYLEKAGP